MAFKTSVPISTSTRTPVGSPVFGGIFSTIKNIPTHLHLGLFGSKTSNLPVSKVGNGMFPTKGGSLSSR